MAHRDSRLPRRPFDFSEFRAGEAPGKHHNGNPGKPTATQYAKKCPSQGEFDRQGNVGKLKKLNATRLRIWGAGVRISSGAPIKSKIYDGCECLSWGHLLN